MTNILFAKTPWGYPILAVSGFTDCIKHEIEGAGADMEGKVVTDSLKSKPDGLYVWIGEYLWGDEWGPQVKTRAVGPATAEDIDRFGLEIARRYSFS